MRSIFNNFLVLFLTKFNFGIFNIKFSKFKKINRKFKSLNLTDICV